MKQLIENLILFQFITGRYSPVMKVKDKKLRVGLYLVIFLLMTAYQLYDYTQSKCKQT